MVVYRACRWKNPHWRQRIWLHLVASLAWNNMVTTIQYQWMIVHYMTHTKTVDLGNTLLKIIRRMDIVTPLRSSYFQALRSFIRRLYSTWYTDRNVPALQAQDSQPMVHYGNYLTRTEVVMVGLTCSPRCSFHDKGCHHQVHGKCLQDCQGITQSISQQLPARLLHLNLLPAHLGDIPSAPRQIDSSRQRNRWNIMSQGLRTCPQWRKCPTLNMMQLFISRIHRTWAVQ